MVKKNHRKVIYVDDEFEDQLKSLYKIFPDCTDDSKLIRVIIGQMVNNNVKEKSLKKINRISKDVAVSNYLLVSIAESMGINSSSIGDKKNLESDLFVKVLSQVSEQYDRNSNRKATHFDNEEKTKQEKGEEGELGYLDNQTYKPLV